MDEKASIRKNALERRRVLESWEVTERSRRIFDLWRGVFEPSRHRRVHTFLSVEKLREVDTKPFLDFLEVNHSDIVIGIPRVDPVSPELTHHRYNRLELVAGPWDILEPSAGSL